MRVCRLCGIILVSLLIVSCSRSKSGDAAGAGAGFGDGNIPVASAGGALSDLNFAFDSATLDHQALQLLRVNGEWIKKNSGSQIVLEGHCDERGTQEYNMALGERRARSAYDYLRSLGVASEQISTISYGEELPLDPTANEVAWAKNRRVHFAITR